MPEPRLHVETFVDPMFGENAYVVFEKDRGPCWIIDPSFEPQPQRIAKTVVEHALQPAAILVTHCHGDHIVGIDTVKQHWPQIRLLVPAQEIGWLTDPRRNLSADFGIPLHIAAPVDQALAGGESLQLGASSWQVLDAGGHSPGSLAYYCPGGKVLFTGDALFAGSIGRTDFPGSDHRRLLMNIRTNLLSLPEDVVIHPGHGPATTVGQERATNPFLQE